LSLSLSQFHSKFKDKAMTDQERQRQMDFIVEQQARFESSVEVGRQELAQMRRMLISDIRPARGNDQKRALSSKPLPTHSFEVRNSLRPFKRKLPPLRSKSIELYLICHRL
jgi:hypothetical protein